MEKNKMKKTIDKKVENLKNFLKKEKNDLAFVGLMGLTAITGGYVISANVQETFNPFEWERDKFGVRYTEVQRNGFHYDLNTKFPEHYVKYENALDGKKE